MPSWPARRETAARSLRQRDKIGYLGMLALPPELAEAWNEIYLEGRDLDAVSERDADHATPALGSRLLDLRPELAPILQAGALWPKVEAALYADPSPRSVATYFELMHPRAFCPVYTYVVLAMPEEDRAHLAAFAMYTGCGGQLVDDTLDLAADIDCGLVFVTIEELEALSLSLRDLGTTSGLRRLVDLRNQWALTFHVQAYRITSAFTPANRRLARTWLEFSMRAILDGRVRPLRDDVLSDQRRYMDEFGLLARVLDTPAPNERCRAAVAGPLARRFASTYAVASLHEAERRLARCPDPLPKALREARVAGVRVPGDDLPEVAYRTDGRRPVRLLHYGAGGILPTLVDVTRIVTGV